MLSRAKSLPALIFLCEYNLNVISVVFEGVTKLKVDFDQVLPCGTSIC